MAIAFAGSIIGSAINGGNITLTISATARVINNYIGVAVTQGTSKTSTLTCTTSGGTTFTQIVTTVNSSNARFGYFRRLIASTGETTISLTGTGGSTDSMVATALIFSGVSTSTPEDATATSTTGSGTTPDSPSITPGTGLNSIISAFGAQISDATVTAPTSFVNQINTNASDTWASTGGQAWITYNSTAVFNPTSWSNLTSASWVSASIILREEPAVFTWSAPAPFSDPDLGRVEIVGY